MRRWGCAGGPGKRCGRGSRAAGAVSGLPVMPGGIVAGIQGEQFTELTARDLVPSLMPKHVRLVPTGIIVVMFVLFLLAIGPLDYFGLGWLKRRSYTWFTFPAATIGFTV